MALMVILGVTNVYARENSSLRSHPLATV
jgi:hypothetical protein